MSKLRATTSRRRRGSRSSEETDRALDSGIPLRPTWAIWEGTDEPAFRVNEPLRTPPVEPAPFVTRSDADPIDGALYASNRWSMDPYSTSGPCAARNRIFHWRLKECLFLFARRLDCRPDAYCARTRFHWKNERERGREIEKEKVWREATLKVNASSKMRYVSSGCTYLPAPKSIIRKHNRHFSSGFLARPHTRWIERMDLWAVFALRCKKGLIQCSMIDRTISKDERMVDTRGVMLHYDFPESMTL